MYKYLSKFRRKHTGTSISTICTSFTYKVPGTQYDEIWARISVLLSVRMWIILRLYAVLRDRQQQRTKLRSCFMFIMHVHIMHTVVK